MRKRIVSHFLTMDGYYEEKSKNTGGLFHYYLLYLC
jgi:hypothetical protein